MNLFSDFNKLDINKYITKLIITTTALVDKSKTNAKMIPPIIETSVIMIEYINGISNVNDLSSALNLTYAYEKYVIGNSCFTLNQQNVLLSGFATAKYSYYFWNSIL